MLSESSERHGNAAAAESDFLAAARLLTLALAGRERVESGAWEPRAIKFS